jgi:hypothetical protein
MKTVTKSTSHCRTIVPIASVSKRLGQTFYIPGISGAIVFASCLFGAFVPGAVGLRHAAAQLQPAGDATPDDIELLAIEQGRIAEKYRAFEQMMIRLAEFDAVSNPQRAALLKRAVQQSSIRLTRSQLTVVTKLLTPPAQLQRAIEDQQAILRDLQELLDLLLTENRSDRLKKERERIREYIKEVERLIRLERSLKAETEAGHELQRLAEKQGRIADRAGELADQIRSDEGIPDGETSPSERSDEPAEKSDSEPNQEPGESPSPAESTPSPEPTPEEGDPQKPPGEQPATPQPSSEESPEQSGESNPSSESPSSESPSSDNPSTESPSSENPAPESSTPESPAQQRIQEAQRRMEQSQERLKEANRQDALEEQERARRELELAKAELERILRQLREEEVERVLASLEERFRHMLEAQLRIYDGTQQLDKLPTTERARDVEIQASKLSSQESKLILDTDKALALLREEGSSVAFPETVEQMRDDMEEVSRRLAEMKVGLITQTAEEAVIDALQEMIAALQQAQEDLEEQRQQQPPQPPSAQGDMPLVDQLAELKMIRALQMRVNTRTERCAQLLVDSDDPVGQTVDDEVRDVLSTLSGRQKRIFEVTRVIVLGKNK